MIRVVLVDDDELIRVGFRMVLDAYDEVEVVGEAGDGAAAVELTQTVPADVVLMDVRMPGVDGVEATRQIRAAGGPAVLVLTTFDLDEYAHAALRAGAAGFLLKNIPPPDLVSAIRSVHAGDAVIAPSTTRRLLERFAAEPAPAQESAIRQDVVLDRLTEREREVLVLVARGLSNTEIAEDLVVAEVTVKTHVGRILRKLEVRDRVQAVIVAYDRGLVERSRTPEV